MKAQIKKILLLVFISVALLKAIDLICFYVINYFYQHTYVGQDGGDLNKYLHDPNPPELVIMGSSTARFQVNPDSFQRRSCNLARAMTTECYDLGLLNIMIAKNKIPKYILLSVWPLNYMGNAHEEKQSEDILFLKYYYKQSTYVKTEIDKISPVEKYKYLFSSYSFNGSLTNILKYYYISKKIGPGHYYFYYEPVTPNDSVNTILASTKRNEFISHKSAEHLSQSKAQYLQQFIDTCKKYNIQLLCYYLPQFKEDTSYVKEGFNFLTRTMTEKNIPFLYFSKDNAGMLLQHPFYWTDGEHLNATGAGIESKMLSAFVEQHLR